jgi:FKBP-type peptidyl-prolyl cis-trans isomerase FklB
VFNTGPFNNKKGTEMKFQMLAALGILAVAAQAHAEDKKDFKDQKEKISYSIGVNVGNNLKRQDVEVDLKSFQQGLKDGISGSEPLISQQESQEIMQAFQNELRQKQEDKRRVQAEKNQQEGPRFLAENRKKPGVVTLPSGLQYKVINEGSGPTPKAEDTVTTHYRGRLIDGTEFDSSYRRGEPAKFPVNRVIPGWTEALQLMPVGSKWELYIPSNLAYGEGGQAQIAPHATLIFEIELLDITPAARSVTQPITSDIIKVPSREELERGAKIEIIKPDQIEKEKARQR